VGDMAHELYGATVTVRCGECGAELRGRSQAAVRAIVARHLSVEHRITALPKQCDQYRAFRATRRLGQSRLGALLEPRGSGQPASRYFDSSAALATIASARRSASRAS
jgi:hypothetical protein